MNSDRKIRTLKDIKTNSGESLFERYEKNDGECKFGVIFSQTTNSYQLFIPKENIYIEIGSSQRGGIPEKNEGAFIFDVASAPRSYDDIKDSLLSMTIEKLSNDLNSINSILEILKEEKDFSIKEVDMKDVIEKIEEYLKIRKDS